MKKIKMDDLVPVKYEIPEKKSDKNQIRVDNVFIEQRKQRDGSIKWVVIKGGNVLNRNGYWEYEPMPSSRSDKFISETRYDTVQEAIDYYNNRIDYDFK